MLEHRPFAQLGRFENDWLKARYHFSFADYIDHRRMGWGVIRVWNDDIIAAGTGFPPHGHRDMEIVTYVRKGAISHQDSLGNDGRTDAGQVQVMSAGTGIRHAEFNQDDKDCTVFQIWLLPKARDMAPRWETRPFPRRKGKLEVLASGFADDEAPHINQDARVLGGVLDAGSTAHHSLGGGHAYLVAARGNPVINGIALAPRDGLAIADERLLTIHCPDECEIVLVDGP